MTINIAEELSEEDRAGRQAVREQAAIFREIDERQPNIGIDSHGETVYHSVASSIRTEVLPTAEHINGNPWGSPTLSLFSTPSNDPTAGPLPPIDR